MQRKRGLISQSSQHDSSVHASERSRKHEDSDEDNFLSSSDSSSLSSPCKQPETSATAPTESVRDSHDEEFDLAVPMGESAHDSSPKADQIECLTEKGSTKKHVKRKGKSDAQGEDRFKKMKLKGSDAEILVDMLRVQKYVDHDSAGISSYQEEVNQARGDFRKQAIADYSDLYLEVAVVLKKKESVADRVKKFKENNSSTPRVSANLHRHQENILRLSSNLAEIVKNASSEELNTIRISVESTNKENLLLADEFDFSSHSAYNSVDDIVSLLRSKALESVPAASVPSGDDLSTTLIEIRNKSTDVSILPAPTVKEKYEDLMEVFAPEEDPSEIIARIKKRLNMASDDLSSETFPGISLPTRQIEKHRMSKTECISIEDETAQDLRIIGFPGIALSSRAISLSAIQTAKIDIPSCCSLQNQHEPRKTPRLVPLEDKKEKAPLVELVPCKVTSSDWRRIVESEIARTRASIFSRIQNYSCSTFLGSFCHFQQIL